MDKNLKKARELFANVIFENIIARRAYNSHDFEKFDTHSEKARKLNKKFNKFMTDKQVDNRLVG